MPLYIDYRPDSLEQVAGNEQIVTALSNLVSRKEGRPHSFLFTGRPGCGKTTFGFVLKNLLEVSDEDFHIYDTANTRGIDVIRGIIDDMKYSPLNGKNKLYLLDECHMATTEALNALLRTLEYGCPEHCYFVLCTAEFDSIKKTLREALGRRCARFEVKALNPREMTDFLNGILKSEGFEEYPENIISKIISVADGSPGEALNALDSVIELTDEEEIIKAIEGYIYGGKEVIEICHILVNDKVLQKWREVSKILAQLKVEDVERSRRAMLNYFEKILLNKADPSVANMMTLLTESFMYTGRAGLTLTCYYICRKLEGLADDVSF